MTEKPMRENREMVRALLDGRKVQTRRPIEPQPKDDALVGFSFFGGKESIEIRDYTEGTSQIIKCPYQIGDHAWVRETWQVDPAGEWGICYRATGHNEKCRWDTHLWRPSIHMPRWASRITLEITGVKVQRLMDITEEDARAEGITSYVEQTPGMQHSEPRRIYPAFPEKDGGFPTAKEAYEALWDSIYGKKYPSDSNPWLFAYTFKRIKP
jgi:hypothetical protein